MKDDRTQLPDTIRPEEKSNDVVALRALLFAEIRSLSGKVNKEQLEIAKVKSELAQTIINSAKVEVMYLQVCNSKSGSGFIPIEAKETPPK